MQNELLLADCSDWSRHAPKSIDLVLTSPPYAQARANHYPSVPEADYPAFTVNWMSASIPFLTDVASVAIVIRSHVRGGAVSDYVLRTRLALHEAGWSEAEELLWWKTDPACVGSKFRPRRSWEHVLWFTRNPRKVFCATKANGRLGRIGKCQNQPTKQMRLGLHEPYPKKESIALTRSSDVIICGSGCASDKSVWNTHPAQFPGELCDHIIRLLCPEGGRVCDPFVGSGTSCLSAYRLGRSYSGSDVVGEYLDIARRRLAEAGEGGLQSA